MATITTSAPGTQSQGTVYSLPDWYTNYGKTVANVGQGIAQSLPGYNGYVDANGNPAPTVAGLNSTQKAGMSNINAGAGAWKSGLDAATAQASASQGTLNAAGGTLGTASGATSSALDSFAAGRNQIAAASGAIQNMGGALSQAQSYLDPAASLTNRGASGSQFSASELAKYVNPYTTGVNNEIARLANQNLTENVLPSVNSTFTGAGQFGSTRNGDFVARALRDNQSTITGQQAKVLMDAQDQALQQAAMAANRDLQAGSQLGGLSGVAQGVAQGYGNQANTQINQGQGTIQAGQGQLSGANSYTQIANSQINQAAQQGALSQLMGQQAALGQQLNLNDANAQLQAGTLQQQTDQKGLDAAKADFLDRRDYPLAALGGLSQILPGISSRITPDQQSIQVNATQRTDPLQSVSDLLGGLSAASR